MSKLDDKMFQRRKAFLHRKRVIEVSGSGQVTPERVKCPFCSELILPDAIKCRFCGEWFSEPDQDMHQEAAFKVNPIRQEPDKLNNPITIITTQTPLEPVQPEQPEENQSPSKAVEEKEVEEVLSESVESEEKPEPVRIAREIIPTGKTIARSAKKGFKIPWLRAFLFLFYLGIAGALIFAEFKVRTILQDAQKQEEAEDISAASTTYRFIQNNYPFTFSSLETHKRLDNLGEDNESNGKSPKWLVALEDLLGIELTVKYLHVLPLIAWPISALVLFIVFLSRIRRFGVASVAVLLMILALLGFVAQLIGYGLIPVQLSILNDTIDEIMLAPEIVYISSYVLLSLAALMTLTANAHQPDPMTMKKSKKR